MAHLPDDNLPSDFDVIVVGTGLIQSILAAAVSRIEKSVLHLDGNSFYGEHWASLMHRDLQAWIKDHKADNNDDVPPQQTTLSSPELKEGEVLIPCRGLDPLQSVFNIVETVHDIVSPDSNQEPNEICEAPPTEPSLLQEDKVTWESLGNKKRRFNFDIMPKLLYCRGQLVDVIVDSGVSRYLEFKSIPKLYCHSNGQNVQVPCSRSDVFNSKIVSMLEKRKLMKFLTFCVEYDQHLQDYESFIDRPFVEFLKSQDLTDNLIHFIIHSIAMVTNDTRTIDGLKATQVFLQSLGRFGNAPFLYPLFGNGELPQGFCRLSAVFGGVYCLKRSISSLVVLDNKITGVICTTGQHIKCSTLIASCNVLHSMLTDDQICSEQISRAIFVIDGPIADIDQKIHLLTLPPYSLSVEQSTRITLLQLDESSLNTPDNIYMVHATCVSYGTSAQQDLQCVATYLFNTKSEQDDRPQLLWSLYYNMKISQVKPQTNSSLPGNVVVTSDPDTTIAYEATIEEAKRIFKEYFPGEEFLPKIPDPEDIIYEMNEPTDETTESNEETPVNQETNEQLKETPVNQETNEQLEEAPANQETNEQSEEAPANQETNEHLKATPVNQITNEQLEEAPANQETHEQLEEAPANQETNKPLEETSGNMTIEDNQ